MNRLFEIILLLIENGKMTADELALHFEVSNRTILRDLDKLLVAKVPIRSIQGHGGGIMIDESYRFPVDYLNEDEKTLLLAGVKALDSVHNANELYGILHRISNHEDMIPSIDIDLSSWYGTSLITKIELIKKAIKANRKLSFVYYKNETSNLVCVSPYQIVFKWSSWYLRAIKDSEDDMKMYKLNRMDALEAENQERCYLKPNAIYTSIDYDAYPKQENYYLEAVFALSKKAKLIDEYGIDSFMEKEGSLYFNHWFANKEYLISWLLSFGKDVEVITPVEIREELKCVIEEMKLLYKHDI